MFNFTYCNMGHIYTPVHILMCLLLDIAFLPTVLCYNLVLPQTPHKGQTAPSHTQFLILTHRPLKLFLETLCHFHSYLPLNQDQDQTWSTFVQMHIQCMQNFPTFFHFFNLLTLISYFCHRFG